MDSVPPLSLDISLLSVFPEWMPQLLFQFSHENFRLLGTVTEALPYPGAKPYFVIDALLDNPQGLVQLVQLTASELPAPKPKKPKPRNRREFD